MVSNLKPYVPQGGHRRTALEARARGLTASLPLSARVLPVLVLVPASLGTRLPVPVPVFVLVSVSVFVIVLVLVFVLVFLLVFVHCPISAGRDSWSPLRHQPSGTAAIGVPMDGAAFAGPEVRDPAVGGAA